MILGKIAYTSTNVYILRPLQNVHFAHFWSLRGAKRRGNLVDYQHVMRLLRFARNDNTEVFQRSHIESMPGGDL